MRALTEPAGGVHLTPEEACMAIYALGSLHAFLVTRRGPADLAMIRSTFPLMKKLGVTFDEAAFDAEFCVSRD